MTPSAHGAIEFIAVLQRMPTLEVLRIASFSDEWWKKIEAKKEYAQRLKKFQKVSEP